jgi:hypothetical protein
MVMLLLPSAKEPAGKKAPNKKNNTNGKKNRFIRTSGNILTFVRPILSFFWTAVHRRRLHYAGLFSNNDTRRSTAAAATDKYS